MPRLGLLRHRCAVAILCCLQLIVSIILVIPISKDLSLYAGGNVYEMGWIFQILFCFSTLFGLFGLFVENVIGMRIFGFSLIILIALLMFITFMLIVVVFTIIVGKYPAMLIGIAWIIGSIIVISLYIYTAVSAFKLSKLYSRPPIQPIPLTVI